MYKTLAFDVDGTLLNTEMALFLALQKTIRDIQGREVTYDDVSFFFGLAGSVTMKRLGVENVDDAVNQWVNNTALFHDHVTIYDGVRNAMDTLLKNQTPMGVITSRLIAEMEPDFTDFDLNKYFKYRVCAEHTQKHKPNSEPMLKFLELAGVKPQDTIYVADTIYDMQCAHSAGVDFAYVTWGVKSPDKAIIEQAKYTFDKPEQLITLVQ